MGDRWPRIAGTLAFFRLVLRLFLLRQGHRLLEGLTHFIQALVAQIVDAFVSLGGEVDQFVIAHVDLPHGACAADAFSVQFSCIFIELSAIDRSIGLTGCVALHQPGTSVGDHSR